jgi:hypothetical protein
MFLRPTTAVVHAKRTPVDEDCPACGKHGLQRYLVLSEGGWWNVVKCPGCLHAVSREPGPLLGPLTAATQALIPAALPHKG